LSIKLTDRCDELTWAVENCDAPAMTFEALNRWLAGLARPNCVLMLFEDAHTRLHRIHPGETACACVS